MLLSQQLKQLTSDVLLFNDVVTDVGTIETGDKMLRIIERETFCDFATGQIGGGRSQRDTRHVGPALMQHRQSEILWAEVMSPLRHAMRLINREQGDLAPRQQLLAALG